MDDARKPKLEKIGHTKTIRGLLSPLKPSLQLAKHTTSIHKFLPKKQFHAGNYQLSYGIISTQLTSFVYYQYENTIVM